MIIFAINRNALPPAVWNMTRLKFWWQTRLTTVCNTDWWTDTVRHMHLDWPRVLHKKENLFHQIYSSKSVNYHFISTLFTSIKLSSTFLQIYMIVLVCANPIVTIVDLEYSTWHQPKYSSVTRNYKSVLLNFSFSLSTEYDLVHHFHTYPSMNVHTSHYSQKSAFMLLYPHIKNKQ